MTDPELLAFLMPGENLSPKEAARVIAGISPTHRATYERMSEVCAEIDLWQAGIGLKPTDVIVCGPKQVRLAKAEASA